MALEKLHGTQIVSWQPPLPQRAFRIVSAGVTSDSTKVAGLQQDGTRYGYYTLDTSKWAVLEGFHTPPVQPGEQFQLWTSYSSSVPFFYPPPFANGNAGPLGTTWASDSYPSPVNSPDLWNVYALTETREMGNNSGQAIYTVKNAQVCTVAAVTQNAAGQWTVYFSPMIQGTSISPQQDGIITIPKPFNPKYLGQIGHVSGVNYTYAIPGGPSQLTCVLQVEPDFRTDALNPGRIITAHRGASCIWEGQLTEPVPAATGWTLTANGAATYGTNFGAWYQTNLGPTSKSNGWTPDAPVDLAISRGLRWKNYGIGVPAGIYTGPLQNPGSLTITDFMNLLCTGGSLIWELQQPASAASWPPGPWELTLYNLPTDQSGDPTVAGPAQQVQTKIFSGGKWKRIDLLSSRPRRPPDLFLVNTSPVGRTITADYNTIILYYQIKPDKTATSTVAASAATYATTFVDNPASVAQHGRMEYYLDISNAGAMTASAAQAIGLNVLSKYIRANFTSAFTVRPGQLLNPGGVPVDLGCNWVGSVVTIQGVNAAQGGEVGLAPLTFVIGQYAFDDDTETAQVTPYQNVKADISSVIATLYPGKFALTTSWMSVLYSFYGSTTEVSESGAGYDVRLRHRDRTRQFQAQARTQELGARSRLGVRLRHRVPGRSRSLVHRRPEVLRLPAQAAGFHRYSGLCSAPPLLHLARYAGPLPQSGREELPMVWCPGHRCVR